MNNVSNWKEALDQFECGATHIFYRDDEVIGLRECTVQTDDPGLDGTGFEHPAYYRGEVRATERVVELLTKVIDGTDPGKGTVNHTGLQAIREYMREAKKKESV